MQEKTPTSSSQKKSATLRFFKNNNNQIVPFRQSVQRSSLRSLMNNKFMRWLIFLGLPKLVRGDFFNFAFNGTHFVFGTDERLASGQRGQIEKAFYQTIIDTLKQGACGVIKQTNLVPAEQTQLWSDRVCSTKFIFNRDAEDLGSKFLENCTDILLNTNSEISRQQCQELDKGGVNALIVVGAVLGGILLCTLILLLISCCDCRCPRRGYDSIPDKKEDPDSVRVINRTIEDGMTTDSKDEDNSIELPTSRRIV